jgi:hypothetical protein
MAQRGGPRAQHESLVRYGMCTARGVGQVSQAWPDLVCLVDKYLQVAGAVVALALKLRVGKLLRGRCVFEVGPGGPGHGLCAVLLRVHRVRNETGIMRRGCTWKLRVSSGRALQLQKSSAAAVALHNGADLGSQQRDGNRHLGLHREGGVVFELLDNSPEVRDAELRGEFLPRRAACECWVACTAPGRGPQARRDTSRI